MSLRILPFYNYIWINKFKMLTQVEKLPWEKELDQNAFRYHVLIVTVAIVLNPIFAVADYFNIPRHFSDFLSFRLLISFVIFCVLLLKNKFRSAPELIALIPFIGISVQNAYMYSVMDIDEIQKHTFSYITLFIGAGMFVLWNIKYSIFVVSVSFVANIICFMTFGKLTVDQVLTNGGLLTISVALFTILLIETRTRLTRKEIISRLALADTNRQLGIKNEMIENYNADVVASLNYAKRIQQAILPPMERIEEDFKDFFVLYEPKDIVSGDFYWYSKVKTTIKGAQSEELILISAVDCTGHGVPGALMSVIGNTALNQSLSQRDINSPAEALTFLDNYLVKHLTSINDGMDIGLCAIHPERLELQFAGANNPLYLIRNNELSIIKADKKAIGGNIGMLQNKQFTNHFIKLEKGDAIYMFSDGYADQFGGPESYTGGKKYKYNRLKNLLLEINQKPMKEQKEILLKEHLNWRGKLEQLDDILVIGLRI